MTPRRRARAEPGAREAPALFDELPVTEPAGVPSPPRTAPPADPGTAPSSAITVGTLSAAVRDVVEGAFPVLWVRGDVIGFKRHRNGHWYFTLKDDRAQVRCVVWAGDTRRMLTAPDEGMAVVVRGQLTVYAARTDLQLRVTAMEGVGEGLWRKAFEEIRARLEADGLLAPERKRALPGFPRRVAVITSVDGAALHDVIAVVARRCPVTEVVAVPATVQGEDAPASLVAALGRVARWGHADVVIIGRGGGGREDLWAFNHEDVARAVAACPVPVISAVGHEVDVTLCDLVADWRAPTPSAAAETAVPMLRDLRRDLAQLRRGLVEAAAFRLERSRERVGHTARAMGRAATRLVERYRLRLEGVAGRLNALSPLATMARGFAVVTDADGALVSSVRAVAPGAVLRIQFRDGRVTVRAEVVDAAPPVADSGGRER